MRRALPALCLLLLVPTGALAQEEGGIMDIPDLQIDLGGDGSKSAAPSSTYEGSLSQSAPDFASGKPLAISHNGPVRVRCADRQGVTARLTYVLTGTNEGAMESMGKGVGLSASGGPGGGAVKSRVPTRPAGVTQADIELTVNVPPAAVLNITGGAGSVDVSGCKGAVKVTNKTGDVMVQGTYTGVSVTTGGAVSVRLDNDSALAGSNVINAGGTIDMTLPLAYAGKFSAKGANVSVFHTVMGTNTGTLVQGTISSGPASLSLATKGDVKVVAP
jgi:hypothetical protein